MMIRMASTFLSSSEKLDPSSITTIQEYELVKNLYSRLVEYDPAGNLVPGAADSFYWEGDDLIFEFGSKVASPEGRVITANDAARSLRRVVMKKKTGHGDIRTFLCPEASIKSVDDPCSGIRIDGNKLVLTPVERHLGAHLLTLLESSDFSIIPGAELDADPRGLRPLRHRNTSGPFYLAEDSPDGNWVLRANPNHYHYNPDLPQEIRLVTVAPPDAAKAFLNKEIDLVPHHVFISGEGAKSVLDNRTQFNVHESVPIKVLMVCFTPRALRSYSAEQRLYVGKALEHFYKENFSVPGAQDTVEFFQRFSEGSLSEEQREKLIERKRSLPPIELERPMQIGAIERAFDRLKKGLSEHSEIEVVKSDLPAYQMPLEERLDAYVISNDSAWTESVSMLGHNFQVGTFHGPSLDGDRWVADYIRIGSREQRLQRLTTLHYELLESVVIYPIYVSPYYAVAHKPWQLGSSTYSAGLELWQVRRAQ